MINTKWASLHKYITKSYYFLAFTENTKIKIQLLSGFVLKQLTLFMVPLTAHAYKTLITTLFYCLLSSLSGILPVLAQCMIKGNQISQVFYSIRAECSLPRR